MSHFLAFFCFQDVNMEQHSSRFVNAVAATDCYKQHLRKKYKLHVCFLGSDSSSSFQLGTAAVLRRLILCIQDFSITKPLNNERSFQGVFFFFKEKNMLNKTLVMREWATFYVLPNMTGGKLFKLFP